MSHVTHVTFMRMDHAPQHVCVCVSVCVCVCVYKKFTQSPRALMVTLAAIRQHDLPITVAV